MITLKSKKLKMLTAGIMLTLAMGLMAGCGGEKKEAKKADAKVNVGIVQLVEHPALDAANKGFVNGEILAQAGRRHGPGDLAQIVVAAQEPLRLGQHRDGGSAGRFVVPGDCDVWKIFRDQSL